MPVVAAIALLTGSGCATLSPDECRHANWEAVGREDGASGHGAERIDAHRKACADHGIEPDVSAYEAGRQRGIERYCTTARGLEAGRNGFGYNDVCPDELADDFLDGYEHGRQMHEVATRLDALAQEIDRVHYVLRNGRNTSERERDYLIYRLRDLEREFGRLEFEYRRLDAMARRMRRERASGA